MAFPFLDPYSASKAALESLSDTLRRELLIYGIDVIVVAPGSVRTPVWDKGVEQDIGPFSEIDYVVTLIGLKREVVGSGMQGVPPSTVRRVIRKALESRRAHTRYEMVPNLLRVWFLPRFLPTRWLDRLIATAIGP